MEMALFGLLPMLAFIALAVWVLVQLSQIASGVQRIARSLESIEQRWSPNEVPGMQGPASEGG